MTGSVSTKFISDLRKLGRQPSPELEALKPHWPDVERRINAERQRLSHKIKNEDPIRLAVDLLSPIRCCKKMRKIFTREPLLI